MDTRLYGIDLDGVCFDFKGAFCKWLESNIGIAIPKDEEITSYYWYESIAGLSKDAFWDEFHKFGDANGYRNLGLLPGVLEGLNSIVAAGHEIIYITNRPTYAFQDTAEALDEYKFPFREELHFAQGSKAPIIREYAVNVFIDDSPRTIADICANTNARIYCMDYPFNRGIHEVKNYTRVNSWEEFLSLEALGTIVYD